MYRVYDLRTEGDQTWLLGEDDSTHEAKLCFYDEKENITKYFAVGSIPHGKINKMQNGDLIVCTEENGALFVDMRPDQTMKTYRFMYNMKPNFCTSTSHAYILKKLEEGFTMTGLKINVGQNEINVEHDFSIPLEMSRPYGLQYILDECVTPNSFILIGSHYGVNKVMAVSESGVSWQITLDHFPISISWYRKAISLDGVKKCIYLILTTESLIAILGSGEVVTTNFAEVSGEISKMVGIKGYVGGFSVIHAVGTEYTDYQIK